MTRSRVPQILFRSTAWNVGVSRDGEVVVALAGENVEVVPTLSPGDAAALAEHLRVAASLAASQRGGAA